METLTKKLHQFWDELNQFDTTQPKQALLFTMDFLCKHVNADNVSWIATVQFPTDRPENLWGWRAKGMFMLHEQVEIDEAYQDHIEYAESNRAREMQIQVARNAGTYRTLCYRKDMSEEWIKSDYYQKYVHSLGISDTLILVQPISDNSEASFMIHKNIPNVFSDEEIEFVALACAPLSSLHKSMMLNDGIGICKSPLAASEKNILEHLLKGKSEMEIAEITDLSQSTVHTYATRIYRKYGVSGCKGLMALWLTY